MHYHFVELEKMEEAVSRGEFLEYARVHANMYGTSAKAVQEVSVVFIHIKALYFLCACLPCIVLFLREFTRKVIPRFTAIQCYMLNIFFLHSINLDIILITSCKLRARYVF